MSLNIGAPFSCLLSLFAGNRQPMLGGMCMKRPGRILLGIAALAMGGGLGAVLLSDFQPWNMLLFLALCFLLGGIFYHIDKALFSP